MSDSPRVTVRGGARDLRLILGEAWRLHPRACVLSFVETVSRVLTALQPTFLGLVVGGLLGHRWWLAVAGLAGLAVALGAEALLSTVGVHERLRLYEIVGHEFDQHTGRLIASPPTLDHLEDPAYLDRVQIFQDRPGVIGTAFNMVVNVANNLLMPVTLVVAAALADWRMLVLALAASVSAAPARGLRPPAGVRS